MLTAADFDQLGFWEDATPEENITVYGMDFGTDYIMLTDDLGKTPLDAKKFIVVAAYDDADCFLWGVELKNFAALKELCAQYAPGSAELFQALKEYKLPKKKIKQCNTAGLFCQRKNCCPASVTLGSSF